MGNDCIVIWLGSNPKEMTFYEKAKLSLHANK
jgi:hypothetical protein